jgi:site-specific DNA recombinase
MKRKLTSKTDYMEKTTKTSATVFDYPQGRIDAVRSGMREKAARGELPGCAPLGYRNVRDHLGSRVELDEETAPRVRAVFELAASNRLSLGQVLKAATEGGLRSRNGRPLGVSGLWYLLANPFYAGLVRYGGETLPGKHPALVDEETFARVQEGLFKRKKLLEK